MTEEVDNNENFTWQQKWLAITPKPFALLSMLGSVYIIKYVLKSTNRRSTVYHRILLGLSVSDFLNSSAIFVGSWTIPKGTPGVYLANGTTTTCTIQGFFIQMGVGTPLYNASLALYYVLVVLYGWKEHELKTIEPALHLFPTLFCIVTALIVAVDDSYRNSNLWCWTTPEKPAFRFGFYYGPVWASAIALTVSMAAIYVHVMAQEIKTAQHRPSRQYARTNTVTAQQHLSRSRSARTRSSRKIAAQALFYVGSFYLTFLFPSWTRASQMINGSSPFLITSLMAVFFPLQG